MSTRHPILLGTLLPTALVLAGLVERPAPRTPRVSQTTSRVGLATVATSLVVPPVERRTETGGRPEIYQFRLRGTATAPGASGLGVLMLAPSPFGIAVTPDGFLVYELELATSGLSFRKSASQSYVVWLTTPDLDRVEKLGILNESGKWRGPLSGMNKFLLMVTLEDAPDVAERRGPILVRGVSPSGLLVSYDNHELFSNMPHE